MTERLDVNGSVLMPLDEVEARAVARQLAQLGVPAVAVVFLLAYANLAHEQRMQQIVKLRGRAAVGLASVIVQDSIGSMWEFFRSIRISLNTLKSCSTKRPF